MPYKGEGSSPLAHIDIMRNPEVESFLASCSYKTDVNEYGQDIRERVLDITDDVRSLPDESAILASDASSYESVIEDNYPSVRVGFLNFAHVHLPVFDYRNLRSDPTAFVDPVQVAKMERRIITMSMTIPGAGLSQIKGESSRTFFRRSIFDRFRLKEGALKGQTLYDTLVDLVRRLGKIVKQDGVEGVVFGGEGSGGKSSAKDPADDSDLEESIFIPVEPGYAVSPSDGVTKVYLTDLLRIYEPFSDEGSNQEANNRLMSAMEHILLAHFLRCAPLIDKSIVDNLFVLIDGPLAIFGEPARFHRAIMDLHHEVVEECRRRGQPGPIVLGLSKTGMIVEHALRIDRILQFEDDGTTRRSGTFVVPIDDVYRKKYVNPHGVDKKKNFGDETYYGQDFIIRTSQGKVFAACLAYPFGSKRGLEGNFRDLKVEIDRYGDRIARAASMIELLQTDMYENSVIAIHLAHKYASIAQTPSGKSLDAFVRSLVRNRN